MAKTTYHGKLTQAAYDKLHPLAQEIHDESRLKGIPCEQISDDQIRYLLAEDFTEEKSLSSSESIRRIGFAG